MRTIEEAIQQAQAEVDRIKALPQHTEKWRILDPAIARLERLQADRDFRRDAEIERDSLRRAAIPLGFRR